MNCFLGVPALPSGFPLYLFRSDTVSLPNSAFDSDSNIRLRKKDAAPIPNASFLFRDGAHRHTIVSFVSTLALTSIVEIEEVREVIVDVFVWRRTPKASVDASIAKHNSVATTRSRKEDTVAIRSYNFCTAHSVYSGPFPCTIVYKFSALLFCRQPPSPTPIGSSSIV